MASKVKYAVSATPIIEVTDGEASGTWSTVAKDIGKTVGGSGSSACGYATVLGYGTATAGNPAYATSGTSMADAGTAVAIDTFTTVKFIFIKHTGFLYGADSATLGGVTDKQLKITMAATIAAGTTLAVLDPGDAIVLPYTSAISPTIFSGGDGVAIAVEYFSVKAS